MKYRFLVVLLLFSVTCAFLALFLTADRDATVTLAELASAGPNNLAPSYGGLEFAPMVAGDDVWLASLEIDSIFYAVLGVCGVVLALRAVVSTLRALKDERAREGRRSGGSGVDIARPVRQELERKAALALVPIVAEAGNTKKTGPIAKPIAASGGPSGFRGHLAQYTHGLTGKMIFTFAGIVAAFGLVTLALVYFTLSSSLSRHIMQRTRVTAVNVSDGAPVYVLKNDAAGLRELLRKLANRPEFAYIFVENRAGEIFAHSFAVIPQEIRGGLSLDDQPVESQRTLKVGDGDVYEVSVPVLEGRAGVVRVGVWREQVDAEINEAVIPLMKLLTWIVCGGILIAVFLAWRINRPIFKLVAAAQAISRGDLDTPSLNVADASEFGELSRALERMRSSVKAAMIRLGR